MGRQFLPGGCLLYTSSSRDGKVGIGVKTSGNNQWEIGNLYFEPNKTVYQSTENTNGYFEEEILLNELFKTASWKLHPLREDYQMCIRDRDMSIFGLLSCIVDLGIFYWFNRKYTMKDPKRIRGMASFFVIVTVLLAENYFQVKSLVFLTIINFCFYAIIFSLVYYEKKMIIRTFEILLGVMIGEILVSLVTMALTMRYELEMILEAVSYTHLL